MLGSALCCCCCCWYHCWCWSECVCLDVGVEVRMHSCIELYAQHLVLIVCIHGASLVPTAPTAWPLLFMPPPLALFIHQPNAIARIVNLDASTKKIIIVAKRHIKAGEEVRETSFARCFSCHIRCFCYSLHI